MSAIISSVFPETQHPKPRLCATWLSLIPIPLSLSAGFQKQEDRKRTVWTRGGHLQRLKRQVDEAKEDSKAHHPHHRHWRRKEGGIEDEKSFHASISRHLGQAMRNAQVGLTGTVRVSPIRFRTPDYTTTNVSSDKMRKSCYFKNVNWPKNCNRERRRRRFFLWRVLFPFWDSSHVGVDVGNPEQANHHACVILKPFSQPSS